jgi:hypothetical protein
MFLSLREVHASCAIRLTGLDARANWRAGRSTDKSFCDKVWGTYRDGAEYSVGLGDRG